MCGRIQKELAQAKYLFPFSSLKLHIFACRLLLPDPEKVALKGLKMDLCDYFASVVFCAKNQSY